MDVVRDRTDEMRRALAAAAVAALLVLSGCAALPWDGTGTPGEKPPSGAPDSPTGTAIPEQTATPVATPSDAPRGTPTATPDVPTATPASTDSPYPPGYASRGIPGPERAARAHVDALTGRESFAVAYNGTILTSNGTTASIRSVQAVDADDGRVHVVANFSDRGTLAQYFENGTLYERRDPPGENNTEYAVREVNYTVERFAGGRLVAPALDEAHYGGVSVVERDDRTFYRYRASEVGDPKPLLGQGVRRDQVATFDAGVVVGADAIVRDVDYRATVVRPGPDARLFVRVRVGGIDATDVDRPSWVDGVRNASSS